MPTHPFHFAMLTHRGRVRKGNEDFCAAAIECGAFLVCDGMGGAAAGEVASRLAGETFLKALAFTPGKKASAHERMVAAVNAANQRVFEQARQAPELRGMGTTLVAMLFEPPGLTLAHVGDSRCYRFREQQLDLLTQDHSLVEEQVRSGDLTPTQAAQHPWRNIITRAVGSQPQVEPEIQQLEPLPGDLFLLASDGLTRELSDTAIAGILAAAQTVPPVVHGPARLGSKHSGSLATADSGPDLAVLARTLVEQANAAGGGDNITVLLLGIR